MFAFCLLVKNYECDYVVQHKDCTYLNEIYSRHKMFVIPPEKTFRVSDVFEEGYNELINEAINLALICIAQNAKHIKSALVCMFVSFSA